MSNIYCVKRGYHAPLQWTQEQKELVRKMYCDDEMSTIAIGEKFGLKYMAICKLLDSMGIKRRRNGMRKYGLNENYFDQIDSHDKAYILGFLFADGSNNLKKHTVSISLQEEDKDILEKMRELVESEKELEFLDYSNKHDFGYNYKNQYRLLFFSGHMCSSLKNLGMIPNKSLKLLFPTIPDEYLNSFIRGYFDGDGSFTYNWSKFGKPQGIIGITSTLDFCETAESYIYKNTGVHGIISDASNHNGITKVLTYSTKKCKPVLDWLYKDADLFLKRKHDRYLNAYYIQDTSISCQHKLTTCAS